MISSVQTNRDECSTNALRDVLNAFGTVAARERRRLHECEDRVRNGRQLLAVRCEKCSTRVAAIYHTSLGRLLVPYGRVILYRLATRDAVAPDLPQRLHERPGLAPEVAAHVFGYVRKFLTEGSAPPVEDDYRHFLANVGKWMREQPILCRCHCAGPSLHELAALRMLDAIGVKPAIGVSAVVTRRSDIPCATARSTGYLPVGM